MNLFFSVAEGVNAAFTLLRDYRFTDAALQNVRIVASTGSPQASLDIRVSDLRVRMGAVPIDVAATEPAPAKVSIALALLIGLIITLLVGLPALYVARRRLRSVKAEQDVS